MKILIVDDEPGILLMYSDKFKEHKHTILTDKNGDECLNIATKAKPDLILLDIIMPKFNGLDVLKKLKSDKELQCIPVILITNLPEEMSGEKARQLGAADYLVKAEHDPTSILEIVERFHDQHKQYFKSKD